MPRNPFLIEILGVLRAIRQPLETGSRKTSPWHPLGTPSQSDFRSQVMIYLLGGSGYIGSAFASNLKRRGVAFRNLSRSELDYTNLSTSSLPRCGRTSREFLVNAAGYTGKPNVDACEIHKSECLAGNAVLPGTIAQACEAANVPWGHVSSGCIYTGSRPDGSGFTEEDRSEFHLPAEQLFLLQRDARHWARKSWPVTRMFTFGACAFPSTNSKTLAIILPN